MSAVLIHSWHVNNVWFGETQRKKQEKRATNIGIDLSNVDVLYIIDEGPQTFDLIENVRKNNLRGPIYPIRYLNTLEEFTTTELLKHISPIERLVNIAKYITDEALNSS